MIGPSKASSQPAQGKKRFSRRCVACKKVFTTAHATKKFCFNACSNKTANAKRPKTSRLDIARRSAPFYRLVLEVKRSGHLEVLSGHTVESLLEVFKLQSQSFRFNEYGQYRAYELSHIAPVSGHRFIGLYRVENLVISPRSLNHNHGTNYYGHGASIPRSSLAPCNAVHESERDSAVLDRIIRYLGTDLVDEVVRLGKIVPTQRFKLIAWLETFIDANPEHSHHLKILASLSTVALGKLKATLQGKENGGFKLITGEYSMFGVMASELQRHAVLRPDLAPLAELITQCSSRIDSRESFLMESPLYQLLFDVMHGKELSDVSEAISPLLSTLQALAKLKTPLLVLAVPETLPAIEAPVRVLKTFSNFADELDGEAFYFIPTLTQSHSASYEGEPLPWD